MKFKFYVLINATHDGGHLEEAETFEEALKIYKDETDAEQIIYGVKINL